jgi:hypothetical protein
LSILKIEASFQEIALALQPLFNELTEIAPLIHWVIGSLKKPGKSPSMTR